MEEFLKFLRKQSTTTVGLLDSGKVNHSLDSYTDSARVARALDGESDSNDTSPGRGNEDHYNHDEQMYAMFYIYGMMFVTLCWVAAYFVLKIYKY